MRNNATSSHLGQVKCTVICVPLVIPEICAPNQAFAIPGAAKIKLTHYHGQGGEFGELHCKLGHAVQIEGRQGS
jgi:hypothetical protein